MWIKGGGGGMLNEEKMYETEEKVDVRQRKLTEEELSYFVLLPRGYSIYLASSFLFSLHQIQIP